MSKKTYGDINNMIQTGLIILLIYLTGCASVGVPLNNELKDVESGKSIIILLRVTITLDGEPYEPFPHSLADDNIDLAFRDREEGSFHRLFQGFTHKLGLGFRGQQSLRLGKWIHVIGLRFLSSETRREGWTYFVIDPGTHYLAVLPPRRGNLFAYERAFKHAPCWQIDIPQDAKVIYPGTLLVPGSGEKLLFGGKIMRNFVGELSVHNEENLARKVWADHLPDVEPPKTALMQRLSGCKIIIQPPPSEKTQ